VVSSSFGHLGENVCFVLIYFGAFTCCFRSPGRDDDGDGKYKKNYEDGET